MVTTNTAQTISGAKTFTSDLTISSKWLELTNDKGIDFGNGKCYITGYSPTGLLDSNPGKIVLRVAAYSTGATNFTFSTMGTGYANFSPSATADLGTSNTRWRNLFLSNSLNIGGSGGISNGTSSVNTFET